MGNQQSKNPPDLKYLINSRKDPIHYKINDDFPYPRRPKSKEVDQQFSQILKMCILTEEQNQEIATLKDDIKWKLICKHRYFLLTAKMHENEPSKEKTKAQIILDSLKKSDCISDIDKLQIWLTQEAKEEDINDFLLYDGLNLLINMLIRAETCSRATQNFNKQLILLQIIGFLTAYQQVINALIQIPKATNAIFVNFNKNQISLDKFVLQILTNISWNSKEGPKLVLDALSFYKTEFGFKLRFEPFIKILEETKNVVLLEMITMFINTLIESPSQEDKREALRSEFTTCDLKSIYHDIKEKIKQNKYKIEDSVYILRRGSEEPKQTQSDPSSSLLLDEKEEFDEKLNSILKQIEIFENGFQEFIEEEDDDDDEAGSDDEQEEPKYKRNCNKKKTMDFSNINDVFAKVVAKTLSSENYENFLKILQQLSLIPSNEQGKKVWNALNSSLQDVTGVKQTTVLQFDQLENLIGQSEAKEELEQKLMFLDNQLKARDDEIKNLKRGKLNMEIQLKGSKKEAQSYEKELNKQVEALKVLEFQMDELKRNKQSIEQPNFMSKDSKNFGSSSKKKTEDTTFDSDVNTTNLSKKANINSDDKKTNSNEKKQGNKSFFANETEYNKFQSPDKKTNKSFYGSGSESDNIKTVEFEDKIKNLNKKIIELERFINVGIDEGFNSSQYHKLQTNLENLGFTPFKKQFKSTKNQNNGESPMKISQLSKNQTSLKDSKELKGDNSSSSNFDQSGNSLNKNNIGFNNYGSNDNCNRGFNNDGNTMNFPNKSSNKGNMGNMSFEDKNESLTYDKKNFGSPNQQGKNSLSGGNITQEPPQRETIKLVVISPSGKQQEKNEIIIEKKQSIKTDSPKIIINQENDSEKSHLSLKPIQKDINEIKPEESKSENKKEDLAIVPPRLSVISEGESPCTSPMNVPPLPPLLGLKPGLPPGLNLLNLLNKKPVGPIKEKKKPNVPMKQVLWTLVNPLNIKGTIWETIDEGTVTYEIPNLECEFTSARPDKPQAVSKIPTKISLIAPGRAQNINIVLSKLKMSPCLIAEAILTLNEELLNLNVVNCLLDAIPNADEISLISNYVGDVDILENPEKYIIEIKDIKNLKIRLQAIQFYFTHKELFDDLQLKIKKLIELFENISKEQRIIVLMKYTLAIGNYMNGESARGGAFGFKLEAFDKVADIKNNNGKKNLLAYVLEIIEKNTGSSFIDVSEEFPLYEFGRKLPISQLFLDLDFIKKGIEYVKIAQQNKNVGVIDHIEKVFGKFESEVKDKFQDIELDLSCLDQKYKRVCEFYCEDPKQVSSEVFVENFYKIWTACKKAKAIIVKENKEFLKDQKKDKPPVNRKSNVGNMFNNPEELANTITHLRMSRGTSIVGKKFDRK